MKHKSEQEEMPFEQALERLEEIVELLEQGEASLEESIRLYEEGMKLVHICSKKLEWAEQQVEILLKKDGELKAIPFQPKEDSND